jgi:hypothetical protein
LVHWDTSEHDWLEGQREKLHLIAMIDDATAVRQLRRLGGPYALCTMCIAVGQRIAMLLERV